MSNHGPSELISGKRKKASSDSDDGSNTSPSVDARDPDSQPCAADADADTPAVAADANFAQGPAVNGASVSSFIACVPLRSRRPYNAVGPTEQQLADPDYIDRGHECSECNQKFDSQGNMARHMRRHSGAKSFTCTECGAGFARSDGLTRHMGTHSALRPYKCDECNKSYADRSGLNAHIRTHNGAKPYLCDYCPKRYAYAAERIRHTRKHHMPEHSDGAYAYGRFQDGQRFDRERDSPVQAMFAYVCECGEGFDFPEHLQNHKVKKSH